MMDDSTVIWRYFDYLKFKDLLETSEIFLCRADKLQESDPYEGTFDLRNHLHLKIAENILMPPQIAELSKQAFLEIYKKIFINCWCINEEESYLMWKAYANEGFAIKTTIGKLKKSLLEHNSKMNLKIDKIQYCGLGELKNLEVLKNEEGNNGKFPENPFERMFFRKLNFFKDEKELRIILSNFETQITKDNIRLQCDLNELIEEVYISPLLKHKSSDGQGRDGDISTIENLIKNKINISNLKTSYIADNLIYNSQVKFDDLIKLIPEVINSSSIGQEARNAKYRVKYCPNSGKILGYYPTNVEYPNNDIDDTNHFIDGLPFIFVDWQTWQNCINHQGQYKVNIKEKSVVKV